MTLKHLIEWHMLQATYAGQREIETNTKECRKANADVFNFHYDAAELLSDILKRLIDWKTKLESVDVSVIDITPHV